MPPSLTPERIQSKMLMAMAFVISFSSALGNSVPCIGHRWLWEDEGRGCTRTSINTNHGQHSMLREGSGRSLYISSLTYGGTDQVTVSTMHLARELNVVNFIGPPFVFVLPVARDLGSTPQDRNDALYLMSEVHRPEVRLSGLFDLSATRNASSVRIVESLDDVVAEVQDVNIAARSWTSGTNRSRTLRTHLVFFSRVYRGPLLSFTTVASLLQALGGLIGNEAPAGVDKRSGRAFNVSCQLLHGPPGRNALVSWRFHSPLPPYTTPHHTPCQSVCTCRWACT